MAVTFVRGTQPNREGWIANLKQNMADTKTVKSIANSIKSVKSEGEKATVDDLWSGPTRD